MRASLTDSLQPLFADSRVGAAPVRSATVDVARGAVAAVHVLLNDLGPADRVAISLCRGGRVETDARWFRLRAVPVEVNTGPVGFVERGRQRNRHVIRRAPFRVYDAMEPIGSSLQAGGPTAALRVEVPIGRAARPGRRDYCIELRCGGDRAQLAFRVHVHRPVVPPVGRDSLPYTNWFHLGLMADRHGLAPWTPAHWRMIGRYARLMAHGRQNTFLVPWRDIFTRTRGGLVLDRDRLRRIVRTFTAAGLYYIESGHVAGRTGGQWEAKTFDIVLGGPRATSVAGNADLAVAARQLMAEIDRNGWRDRWIQHVTDEPTGSNADDYRILAGMVRRHMPGLPILDATMDPALAGAVDIWCPQAQEFHKHRRRFAAQQALGDRVWFYTCCFPGGPWLNRLLDMELLRPALLGWAAARFDLDGFLHWGLNQYRPDQDPLQTSVVPHGEGKHLPAGDTHIVYPGPGRPWSSLRLEAQREGLEDYELLRQLKACRPARADAIAARAIRAMNDYTRDVKVFRAARRALLVAMAK